MEFEAATPRFAERVRESFHAQAFMGFIGAESPDIQPGAVTIELPHQPELTHQH